MRTAGCVSGWAGTGHAMATSTMDSGLGEALSSYQPKLLSSEMWGRFREDAIGLVVQLRNPSTHRAIQRLSRLAAFLADVAPTRPEATLADLLTREQIDGFLQRQRAAGTASGTVDNYRAALNALLSVREGRVHRQPARRQQESHLAPYGEAKLIRLIAAGTDDGSVDALALARTAATVLAGVRLPRNGQRLTVETEVEGGVVQVAGRQWVAPRGLPLPPSGELDAAGVAAGRGWARAVLDQRLGFRELELTAITTLVETSPATATLRLKGVGRDRLTAATAAAARPSDEEVVALLRGR